MYTRTCEHAIIVCNNYRDSEKVSCIYTMYVYESRLVNLLNITAQTHSLYTSFMR